MESSLLNEEVLQAVGIETEKPLRAARMRIAFVLPKGVAHAAQIDGEEWIASEHVAIDVTKRAPRLIVPSGR